MTVAIIDYGSGNLRSAAKAFERAAREAGLNTEVAITADPEVVRGAERVVLPGVGAFGACRDGLHALPGMVDALEEVAIGRGRPFFGICVGMQLMASLGREHGDHPGLGWIPGEVTALAPADPALKIPHMGWNALELPQNGEIQQPSHPVLEGLGADAYVYFVHGYQFRPDSPEHLLARVDYGGPVVAAVGRDNLFGTQFHPEKSQAAGLAIIGNFLRWRP
jgi:glutamine amidotransferase